MKLVEFRLFMPTSPEQYRRCQLYLVAKASLDNSGGADAMQILINDEYEEDGVIGQYTYKRLSLASKLPHWLRVFFNSSLIVFDEKSWNAFPRLKTLYKSQHFPKAEISVESQHHVGVNTHDNALNLCQEDLVRRKIVEIDIATDPVSDFYYKPEEDPTIFKSAVSGIGPLKDGWRTTAVPIMTCYKVFKIDLPYLGLLSSKVESWVARVMQEQLLIYHRKAFCWMDEWYHLTIEEIRKMEDEVKEKLDLMWKVEGDSEVEIPESISTEREKEAMNEGSAEESKLSQSEELSSDEYAPSLLNRPPSAVEFDTQYQKGGVWPQKGAVYGDVHLAKSPYTTTYHVGGASTEQSYHSLPGGEHAHRSSPPASPASALKRDGPFPINTHILSPSASASHADTGVAASSASPLAQPSSVISGSLYKLGDGLWNTNWNTRHFVLNGAMISYYNDSKETKPKDTFSVYGSNISYTGEIRERTHSFTVYPVSRRSLTLSAEDEESTRAWMARFILASSGAVLENIPQGMEVNGMPLVTDGLSSQRIGDASVEMHFPSKDQPEKPDHLLLQEPFSLPRARVASQDLASSGGSPLLGFQEDTIQGYADVDALLTNTKAGAEGDTHHAAGRKAKHGRSGSLKAESMPHQGESTHILQACIQELTSAIQDDCYTLVGNSNGMRLSVKNVSHWSIFSYLAAPNMSVASSPQNNFLNIAADSAAFAHTHTSDIPLKASQASSEWAGITHTSDIPLKASQASSVATGHTRKHTGNAINKSQAADSVPPNNTESSTLGLFRQKPSTSPHLLPSDAQTIAETIKSSSSSSFFRSNFSTLHTIFNVFPLFFLRTVSSKILAPIFSNKSSFFLFFLLAFLTVLLVQSAASLCSETFFLLTTLPLHLFADLLNIRLYLFGENTKNGVYFEYFGGMLWRICWYFVFVCVLSTLVFATFKRLLFKVFEDEDKQREGFVSFASRRQMGSRNLLDGLRGRRKPPGSPVLFPTLPKGKSLNLVVKCTLEITSTAVELFGILMDTDQTADWRIGHSFSYRIDGEDAQTDYVFDVFKPIAFDSPNPLTAQLNKRITLRSLYRTRWWKARLDGSYWIIMCSSKTGERRLKRALSRDVQDLPAVADTAISKGFEIFYINPLPNKRCLLTSLTCVEFGGSLPRWYAEMAVVFRAKNSAGFRDLISTYRTVPLNQNSSESTELSKISFLDPFNLDEKEKDDSSKPVEKSSTSSYCVSEIVPRKEWPISGYTRASSGGILCIDKDGIQKQKGIVIDLLKSFGKAMLEGRGIVGISLPVRIFEPKSLLEKLVDSWGLAPMLLTKAASFASSPLERFKYTITFAISCLHAACVHLKPFNPILGETFQAEWLDGSKIYLEHTSHHPPISHFLVIGPSSCYKLFGYYEFRGNLKGNYGISSQEGCTYVQFLDGTKISWTLPTGKLKGLIWGQRIFEWLEKMEFQDLTNSYKCTIRFGSGGQRASGFQKILSENFFGYITNAEDEILSTASGSWLDWVEFDGKRYWDLYDYELIQPRLPQKDVLLASDSRMREDSYYLKIGDLDSAQNWKVSLEVLQRHDRGLRLQKSRLANPTEISAA